MRLFTMTALLGALLAVTGCNNASDDADTIEGTHVHDDGTVHSDHADDGDDAESMDDAGDHAHDEASLGSVTIGGMSIELAQSHGAVEPGKEGHLIVKLPYTDGGATIVRAWIGTEDRTMSRVGLGDYAPSHDDYDIHAIAPDPLPDDAQWWIEIEKPDGEKIIGSADPIMD